MELKEVKDYLKDHPQIEWLSNKEISVSFSSDPFEKTFKGFLAFYRFILKQVKGFEYLAVVQENRDIAESQKKFQSALKGLDTFINISKNVSNERQIISSWNNTVEKMLSRLNTHQLLRADSSKMIFLEKVHLNYPEAVTDAYNFFTNQSTTSNSRDALIGRNLAYEFMVAEFSDILGRKKVERDRLLKFINDFDGRIAEVDTDLEAHFATSLEKGGEFADAITKLEKAKREEIETFISSKTREFNRFDKESKDKIATLESAYGEKLRLSKPAQYWKERSEDLKKEAWRTTYIMIGVTLIIAASLYWLLWKTPEGMLLSFTENNSSAIKWTILYITFLSSLVFLVRGLYKLAFSAFHLARDAEEREQLMHVYLSMMKESAIDKEDRQLIVQSLFSRADTGLLKEDSGPTMPSSIINKVISSK